MPRNCVLQRVSRTSTSKCNLFWERTWTLRSLDLNLCLSTDKGLRHNSTSNKSGRQLPQKKRGRTRFSQQNCQASAAVSWARFSRLTQDSDTSLQLRRETRRKHLSRLLDQLTSKWNKIPMPCQQPLQEETLYPGPSLWQRLWAMRWRKRLNKKWRTRRSMPPSRKRMKRATSTLMGLIDNWD